MIGSYWHNYYTNLAVKYNNFPLKQVGKTISGQEISRDQVDLILQQIVTHLKLSTKDKLVDLCCGNGVLSSCLASYSASIIGIDFVKELIEFAIAHNSCNNVSYICNDILKVDPKIFNESNLFLMYEGLQYLDPVQFFSLLNRLHRSNDELTIFIGGVPDRERLHNFYDTDEKFKFYLECERIGRPHLGRWWLQDEIKHAAKKAGYNFFLISQPAKLYTANYRFDILLERRA